MAPWPLGRSSCQGNGHAAPGAQGWDAAGARRGRVREVLSPPGSVQGEPPMVLTHQEDCSGSPRRSPFQFQKSKTDSFFPPMSLCITTGQHCPFALEQGLPNPAPWTGTPVRSWATQLEVRGSLKQLQISILAGLKSEWNILLFCCQVVSDSSYPMDCSTPGFCSPVSPGV